MISTSLSTLRRSSLEVHCTNLAAKVSPEVKCTHFSTFPNFPLEDRSESCYRIWNFDNGEDFELSSMDNGVCISICSATRNGQIT